MAEEVATPPVAPASEPGLFSLYGYFDKKEVKVPEESQDHPSATETEVKDEGKHGDEIKPHHDSQSEPEEEEGGHDLTSQHRRTNPPHAATESREEEGGRHGDPSAAVEEEEEGRIKPPHTPDSYSENQPADAFPTDPPDYAAEERRDDQIMPPAKTHTDSDEGQQILGFDEEQDTHGSSSKSSSDEEEEENDQKKKEDEEEEENKQKKEEEKKKKSGSVKNNFGGKLPEEQYPSPKMEENPSPYSPVTEGKTGENIEDPSPYSPVTEGKTGENIEGVRKKRTVKDKIKEKLAGVGHQSTDSGDEEKSKPGLLDRIKEKIPGHHAKE